MMHSDALNYINGHNTRINKYHTQLLSGKRVNKPSDDPISMTSILNNRRDISRIKQYEKNISTARSHIETTEAALSQLTDLFGRVNELLIQGSSDTYDKDALSAISDEMKELKEQIGVIANTKHGNYYIFGGTDTKTPPYDTATGMWQANPGANKPIEIEISDGTFIPLNSDGEVVFNGKGSSKNLFTLMDDIINDLDTGDTESLRKNRIEELSKATDQTLQSMSKVGTNLNRIDIIEDKNTTLFLNSKEDLSNKEDADLEEVYIELKSAEVIYKSSLSVAARILQTSLMDFIR